MGEVTLNPYAYLVDTQGTALDGGLIYVGAVNESPVTSPIDLFYDADLTIAAPNPVQTVGGFASRSGSPANIYAGERRYSIKVIDKDGVGVFENPNVESRFGVFQIAAIDSVPRSTDSKLSDIRSVKDFGAAGDGITDDTAAFAAAGDYAFVPAGEYLVDPEQIAVNKLQSFGNAKLILAGGGYVWLGASYKGTIYIRNDDRNIDNTPKVPADGLFNLADGELKFLCDLDGDGDYDADIYGKNNLYVAGRNSIHFRIAPQETNEGRIRLAATTNTNFIQSGKDFSGTTIKNLAFSPYLSTDYWAFISQSSGFFGIGNNASLLAPLHVYNAEATVGLFENTGSDIARIGFKGTGTTAGNTVTVGAKGDDLVFRAGGVDRVTLTADDPRLRVQCSLAVNVTSPAILATGEACLYHPDNATLRFIVRGTDGTLRSADLAIDADPIDYLEILNEALGE